MSARTRYGEWPSPVSAEVVAQASISYDAVQMAGKAIYWVEGRPAEEGRDALVRWTPGDGPRDVLPEVSVASHVHGYGGGAYVAGRHAIWFIDADDQRLYGLSGHGPPRSLTAPPESPSAAAYADVRVTPDQRHLVCVRERRELGGVVNELVALPVDGSEEPWVIASGSDFYAFPRPSPDGRWMAWTTWRTPLMPWDGTWLWLAELRSDGRPGPPELVAGGPDESVFQPEWSPGGVLHFVSDRSGWWNLYARTGGRVEPVFTLEAELGVAQWEFGYSTYAFLAGGRIAVLVQEGSRQRLAILHPSTGQLQPVGLPYTSIKPYLASDGQHVAVIGSDPTQTPTVATVDSRTGHYRELAGGTTSIEVAYVARPEPFSYPTRDGRHAHGLFYPPTNPQVPAPREDRPPLIVRPHPGPTANTPLRLDPYVQFFTSRGFAVADIDYRGSTGYGRTYRQALLGRWGSLDVDDCVDAVDHLAATRRVDLQHVAISGASAGGYTALRAIATSHRFCAGVARSAIVDPWAWREVAPKFQAHYVEGLVGARQGTEDPDAGCLLSGSTRGRPPVLLINGGKDPVTPADHARALAQVLGEQAHLLVYPEEGHALRRSHNIASALRAELVFLRRCMRPLTPPGRRARAGP
ncbi:MAG: prolyl oligopeptidase family serine peptidase [Streptomycetales bacterium]